MTHWSLADGTGVEIINYLDDHSRLCVASVAVPVARATDVAHVFMAATSRYGLPASVLTDNGCIYTARYRGGKVAVEIDNHGTITIRYQRRFHHIGMGARNRGRDIIMLIADRDIRIVTPDGETLRHLELDLTRDYQPPTTGWISTMS